MAQLNVQLSVTSSEIQPGTYSVTEVLTGTSIGDLSINSEGGFDFTPFETLEAFTSCILILEVQ
jgi:hypothetical protein